MVAKELARKSIVILTDEYNTSQACSCCKKNKVIHPRIKYKKIKKIKVENKSQRKRVVVEEERELYKLCCCNCNDNPLEKLMDSHKVWNRDYNSSRNILHVGISKLQNKRLGIFKRSIKEDPQICFSLEKQDAENRIQTKEISLKTKMPEKKNQPKKNQKEINQKK